MQVDYCKTLKQLRDDHLAAQAAEAEKEEIDIETGIEDMEDAESTPAKPMG